MPLAFALALAASLGIHVAALFGTDVELFGGGADEPITLQAELQPLPLAPPPAVAKKPIEKPAGPAAQHRSKRPAKPRLAGEKPAAVSSPPKATSVDTDVAAADSQNADNLPLTASTPQPPAQPILPASGSIRYVIYMGTQKFQIGRAEHHWEFTEDGRYRLRGMTETSGLVALFKTLRFENESSGRLVAGGLQPDTYRTRKNGKDANENADFDWPAAAVRLSRDGSVRAMSPGTQDILSLNYQLAYLKHPENGASIGVVTGKKYERYPLDSLGEEMLQTPAGNFRTLHLRAMTDNVTEIWIALDQHRLPVKIRFTDKKGDIYEQVATEIGTP